jgi:hypothetical protein
MQIRASICTSMSSIVMPQGQETPEGHMEQCFIFVIILQDGRILHTADCGY